MHTSKLELLKQQMPLELNADSGKFAILSVSNGYVVRMLLPPTFTLEDFSSTALTDVSLEPSDPASESIAGQSFGEEVINYRRAYIAYRAAEIEKFLDMHDKLKMCLLDYIKGIAGVSVAFIKDASDRNIAKILKDPEEPQDILALDCKFVIYFNRNYSRLERLSNFVTNVINGTKDFFDFSSEPKNEECAAQVRYNITSSEMREAFYFDLNVGDVVLSDGISCCTSEPEIHFIKGQSFVNLRMIKGFFRLADKLFSERATQ